MRNIECTYIDGVDSLYEIDDNSITLSSLQLLYKIGDFEGFVNIVRNRDLVDFQVRGSCSETFRTKMENLIEDSVMKLYSDGYNCETVIKIFSHTIFTDLYSERYIAMIALCFVSICEPKYDLFSKPVFNTCYGILLATVKAVYISRNIDDCSYSLDKMYKTAYDKCKSLYIDDVTFMPIIEKILECSEGDIFEHSKFSKYVESKWSLCI